MSQTSTPRRRTLDVLASAAQAGDGESLHELLQAIQPDVYRLALRFFGDPTDAQDAAQEALVQLTTKLDRFAGDSAFSTWMYRVATNKFLSMARGRGERNALTLDAFKEELGRLPASPDSSSEWQSADHHLLLEEIKIGCTLAMLLCLERGDRMAFILGAIMELDHQHAAQILNIGPPAFRKRLQRARGRITELMQSRCGLFEPANPCRCVRRIPCAMERGRLVTEDFMLASSREQAQRFPEVLDEIRRLEQAQRAAALYRSHPDIMPKANLAAFVYDSFAAEGSSPDT